MGLGAVEALRGGKGAQQVPHYGYAPVGEFHEEVASG